MDIPPGGAQPAYPWRGRITAQSADDVSAFFDNGYRRMILHYANLCAAAGGVESFLIGSELKGLTTSRTGRGVYPAVAALARLAGDVAAILPNAKSPMRPTGRNISATIRMTAAATITSISMRCGRRRRSIMW